jgi:hypothetical protein
MVPALVVGDLHAIAIHQQNPMGKSPLPHVQVEWVGPIQIRIEKNGPHVTGEQSVWSALFELQSIASSAFS